MLRWPYVDRIRPGEVPAESLRQERCQERCTQERCRAPRGPLARASPLFVPREPHAPPVLRSGAPGKRHFARVPRSVEPVQRHDAQVRPAEEPVQRPMPNVNLRRHRCNVTMHRFPGPFPSGSVTLPRFLGPKDEGNVALHQFTLWRNRGNVTFPWCNVREHRGIVTRNHFHDPWNLCNVSLHRFLGPLRRGMSRFPGASTESPWERHASPGRQTVSPGEVERCQPKSWKAASGRGAPGEVPRREGATRTVEGRRASLGEGGLGRQPSAPRLEAAGRSPRISLAWTVRLDGSSRCVQETREEPQCAFDRIGGSNQRSVKLRSAICATRVLAVALRLVWRPSVRVSRRLRSIHRRSARRRRSATRWPTPSRGRGR